MRVEAQGAVVNPTAFSGTETGSEVSFIISGPAVSYQITETFPPPVGGLNLFASQDTGCLFDIRPQESKTCSITDEYRVVQPTS